MVIRQALHLGDLLNLRIADADFLPGGRELFSGLLERALRPRDDLCVLLRDNEAVQEARLLLARDAALKACLFRRKALALRCRDTEAL